jgi:uridine kinase
MKIAALIGGSGSGKSTVLRGLRNHFDDRVSVLSLDDYYRPKSELPVDENGATNFDLPEVIDEVALVRDIQRLQRGEPVTLETYTYNRDVMTSEQITIAPAEWLVVEGLFVMAYPEMERLVDLVAYIDAPESVRLQRRIQRDGSERGYSEDEVRYQWRHHVRPADLAHIEPWREKAHVLVDNHHHWQEGLSALINQMETFHP